MRSKQGLVVDDLGDEKSAISRYFLAGLVFLIFVALSVLTMIALVSDWPSVLHGSSDSPTIHNHYFAIHKTVSVTHHERSIFRKFFRTAQTAS